MAVQLRRQAGQAGQTDQPPSASLLLKEVEQAALPGSWAGMERLDATAIAAGRATAIVAAGSGRSAVAAGATVRLVSSDASTLLPLPPGVAGKPIASLAASRSGRLVAAGEKGSKPGLYLWTAAPEGTAQPPGLEVARALHSFSVAALTFSPSGALAAWASRMHKQSASAPDRQHPRSFPEPTAG